MTTEDIAGYPTGSVRPGRVVELMRRYPHLHGDLSAGSGFNAVARDEEFGLAFLHEFQDRLHFGTDRYSAELKTPLPPWFAEQRASGALEAEAAEKIAYKNTESLLGL